uniref:Cell death inducing DFFA like effector c n=1 Tax=Scleropages formosus TaxID=113540 RepID=A0A8C9T6X1_SCLFO
GNNSDTLERHAAQPATMTQQLFTGRTPRPKPFRVSNADRSVKKGIMADGLHDLLEKVRGGTGSVVLDEDGTGVDTEDFFHTLQDNTVLMLLEKGQKWTPPQVSPETPPFPDVARLTFDLYKNNPEEFIGCLNVKATLYGVYSLSYDLRCYRAKTMIKEMLRWTLFSMQATGHVLLGTSGYMQQLLDEEEVAEKEVGRLRGTVRKTMQSIEWRKTRC